MKRREFIRKGSAVILAASVVPASADDKFVSGFVKEGEQVVGSIVSFRISSIDAAQFSKHLQDGIKLPKTT